MVCGCSSACVEKPEIRNLARQWILVAGKSVDLENAPEEKLADIAARKIKKLK
jgi:hypothetical protein